MNTLAKSLISLTGLLAVLLLIGGVFASVFLGVETYLETKYDMHYNVTTGNCFVIGVHSEIGIEDPRCEQLRQWSLGWGLIGIGLFLIYGSIALVGLGFINFLLEYLHFRKTKKIRFLRWNILFLLIGLVPFGIFWMILEFN